MEKKYFVVIATYEIWEKYRDKYFKAIEKVKENALNLGAVAYYLLEDDDIPNKFSEVMIFDSWSHFRLVQSKKLTPEMERIFDDITSWTIGGEREINVSYKNILLGEWWHETVLKADESEEEDQ